MRLRARLPAALTLELPAAPEVAVAVKAFLSATGPSASTTTPVLPRVAPPSRKASVTRLMRLSATATPTPTAPEEVALPSAVAVAVFLDAACTVWLCPALTLAPLMCARVAPLTTFTDNAPTTPMLPSAVFAWSLPRELSLGALSFWVEPPGLALLVADRVASESALRVSFPPVVVAVGLVESIELSVIWPRLTTAMPAPEVAPVASPRAVSVAVLVAVRSRLPVTARRAVSVTFVMVVAVTVMMATAASKLDPPGEPASPSVLPADPGVAPAVTVDVDVIVTSAPPMTTAVSPSVTVACDVMTATSP